jgi:hypothetical protein
MSNLVNIYRVVSEIKTKDGKTWSLRYTLVLRNLFEDRIRSILVEHKCLLGLELDTDVEVTVMNIVRMSLLTIRNFAVRRIWLGSTASSYAAVLVFKFRTSKTTENV